jgi:hypothetical protein
MEEKRTLIANVVVLEVDGAEGGESGADFRKQREGVVRVEVVVEWNDVAGMEFEVAFLHCSVCCMFVGRSFFFCQEAPLEMSLLLFFL